MIVLDSDVLIDFLDGRSPGPEFVESQWTRGEAVSITAVTLGEVLRGIERGHRPASDRAMLEEFLAGLTVLEYDADCARTFGSVMSQLDRAGRRAPEVDAQVAAIAITHGATLATRNRRHFERFPGLRFVIP